MVESIWEWLEVLLLSLQRERVAYKWTKVRVKGHVPRGQRKTS